MSKNDESIDESEHVPDAGRVTSEKSTPLEELDPAILGDAGGQAMQSSVLIEAGAAPENCEHLRRSRIFLLALVSVTGLGPLAMSSFIPALPAIQQDFGVSASISQLTISAAMISMAVGSLFYGNLADRFGRRPVLLTGVALAIVGSAICATGSTIWMVIAGRCLQAAGGTVGFVLARVVVKDVYGEREAGSVLGYVTAAMALAPLIGPLIGGYLIEYLSWRAVLIVVGVVATLLFVALSVTLPETRPDSVRGDKSAVPWRLFATLLRRRGYRRMVIYGAALQGSFMAFVAGAPFIFSDVFRLPISSYGWYFGIVPTGYFLGSMIAGRFGSTFKNSRIIWLGALGAVTACLIAVAIAAIGTLGAWGFFIPAALLAIAQGVALPGAQIMLLTAADPHSGSGSGLFSALQLTSGALLAQGVGVMLTGGTLGVTTLMLATTLLALLVSVDRSRPSSDIPEKAPT